MKIWPRKKEAVEPTSAAETHSGTVVESYTTGSAAVVKAGIVVFYLAVALALVLSVVAISRPVTAANGSTKPVVAADQGKNDGAGALAAGYVGAWLSATQKSYADLSQYIDVKTVADLPTAGITYRDITVATVTTDPTSQLASVTIAANIKESDAKGQEIWPHRYYQVTINTGSNALGVVGMPAPVAAPAAQVNGASLIYSVSVAPNDPAAQTITAFLNAYAAGQGDMSRYVSPGSKLAAITPPQFSAVQIQSVTTDTKPDPNPADTNQLRALIQAQMTTAPGNKISATYALTLTARAGRWEITTIDPTPAINPTTTPTKGTTP